MIDRTLLGQLTAEVSHELVRACERFEPMHSPHEAIAVIHEEFRELQEHVYRNTGRTPAAMIEAVQLAAMALRYVLDLGDGR